ncbi:caspase domain-containing protein [Penicillium samsonianum]|uniref:caspase domain-containing protein n=1 Tax=Penicillium samsonianum TaxID=1882272 RepID=UPI002547D88C|nr:caspase domain-containing protein [Penicillium samsonianum]KAJ6140409.1 caspase domain-containing protein [Penicillium samsonianum]
MAPDKRALLISSPYNGLLGPANDIKLMSSVLGRKGFKLTECSGRNATRNSIKSAWSKLTQQCSDQDVVVIYYSGHGGLVQSPVRPAADSDQRANGEKAPWRYQFIVPIDYHETTENDFRGVLDVELSHLLRDTTQKTKNVTVILDCCHSGRMSRDPSLGTRAVPRYIAEQEHKRIGEYIEMLRKKGELKGETFLEGNPNAVRIVACNTSESAFEYETMSGSWTGAFTEALAQALQESDGQEVSWSTTLLRVGQLVNVRFPQQHPHAEGPHARMPFTLKEASRTLLLRMEGSVGILSAGRVGGVRENNAYTIYPFISDAGEARTQIATGFVTNVAGFRSRVHLEFKGEEKSIPAEGAKAVLEQEALYEWPIEFPAGLERLQLLVDESDYLRPRDADDKDPLAVIRQSGPTIEVVNSKGTPIAARTAHDPNSLRQVFNDIVIDAEELARGQHLLGLDCENPEERLRHKIKIEFGLAVKGKRGRMIAQDGTGYLADGDRVFINLRNEGDNSVYISLFDVNVAGRISYLSRSSPSGIDLESGRSYTLGAKDLDRGLPGLPVTWPNQVPMSNKVDETLVAVVTSSPVDIGYLGNPRSETEVRSSGKAAGTQSNLEQLIDTISSGQRRTIGVEEDAPSIRYDVIQIPFTLRTTPTDSYGRHVEQDG